MDKQKFAIIILGASGDLSKRKLIPALNNLFTSGVFDESSIIVGSGRTAFSDEEFRKQVPLPDNFSKLIYYHQGLEGLKKFIESKGTFNKFVIFMALPPEAYAETIQNLYEGGFNENTSLIIEKPFGYDLDSAVSLNRHISKYYKESQIYRNDHYLAKEAVQNILVFRFANSMFQSIWNSSHVESIQINAIETLGIGTRGAYFDRSGIIRDVAQNHLMQLLCLMTMEAPVSLNAEDIMSKKIDVLRMVSVDNFYRYQYEGYHNEKGVASGSTTETFAEIKFSINNFRWAGTPIFIRCGKAANRSGTEICVRFKSLPKVLFNDKNTVPQNTIIFKIQPAEGIIVNMSSKEPGNEVKLSTTNMTFCYRDAFTSALAEAYQRILLDVFRDDHTLFVTAQESELLWKIFHNVLDQGPITQYPKGKIPQTAFDIEWTDFDRYSQLCT